MTNTQEAVDKAAADLVLEIGFTVPKGTNLRRIIEKMTAYKNAIIARERDERGEGSAVRRGV